MTRPGGGCGGQWRGGGGCSAAQQQWSYFFPLLWLRIKPWKQTIRQWQTWGFRSLGQSQKGCQLSTAGWPRICTWFQWLDPSSKAFPPFPHSKVDCPGPKGLSVKTRKQLAVETLRDQQCIKVTLMLVASCPHRRKHLTSFRFLPFIQVLTWKWRWYEWRRKKGGGWWRNKQDEALGRKEM